MNGIRWGIRVALLLSLLMAVLAARVVTSARFELKIADEKLRRGDLDGAIDQYRRAARWYMPGSPYHLLALDRLVFLASQAEQRGYPERALSAYRAIRGAMFSARSFYVPEPDRVNKADHKIAALMASSLPSGSEQLKQKRTDEYLTLLRARPDPNPYWCALALAGFLLWVGAGYRFTVTAIDSMGRLRGPEARRLGTLIILGLGIFSLGLALA
jgi:hypothetical protein